MFPRIFTPRVKAILSGIGTVLAALLLLGALASHNWNTTSGNVDVQGTANRTHELITNSIPDPQLISHNATYHDDVVDASGAIENKGSAATKDVRVKVTIFDGSLAIGSGQEDLGPLGPGEKRSYSLTVHLSSTPDRVSTKILWTWAADMCPRGSVPSPDSTDSTAQFCNSPSAP